MQRKKSQRVSPRHACSTLVIVNPSSAGRSRISWLTRDFMISGKKGGKRSLSASAEVIPVHRQTIDLPTGDGTDEGIINALKAAGEITRAMRAERRAKIKENNFLRTMK